jgi:hypothetical protein
VLIKIKAKEREFRDTSSDGSPKKNSSGWKWPSQSPTPPNGELESRAGRDERVANFLRREERIPETVRSPIL